MDNLKKEILNDFLIFQGLILSILYAIFQDLSICGGFLVGGAISLGNFNLMVGNAQSLRDNKGAKGFTAGFGVRYLIMVGVTFFALSIQKFNPFSLVCGLLSVQYVLFLREILKWAIFKGSES